MDVYPDISFVRGLLAAGFLLTSGAPIAATETGEWVLVREGKPVATIVTPDEPLAASHHEMGFIDATQVTAAEVLQTYLERVSGARLPIVSAAMAPETGPLIVVGRNGLTDAAGLFPPTEPEGFRVAAWSRGLAILGEIADAANPAHNTATDLDRGILHGVYAFLERDIGYRFYFANPDDPDLGMVIPRRPTVAIPLPLAYADAPVFSLRQHTSLGHLGASRGGASDRFHANHTHVGWRDRFRDSHPEFFALNADGTRNGRYLCYSEPGVLQAELAQLEQHYGGAREMAMVSRRFIPVLPDDNWRVCHCERCQAWHQGGPFWGRFSDLWFDYVRRLAAEVGRRWPETRVSTLAYRNQTQPPTLDLPDNVDVMVCLHPYGPAVPIGQLYMAKQPHIYAANLDLMLRWRGKLGDDPSRLSFWAYYICPDAHTGMPVLFPNVLQAWLRDVRPLCRGTFIDSGERNPGTHLMLWLWMRMLWDTEIDIDAALEDHCRQFYGPAGESMRAVHRILIDRYEQTRFPARQFREERLTYFSHSLNMVYGSMYPREVIDRIAQGLHDASRHLGLPTDPDWDVRADTAWLLRNGSDTSRVYPVGLRVLDGVISRPVLRWEGGRLVYAGNLSAGDRLRVEPGPRAILFRHGERRDVSARLQGDLPTVPAGSSLVVQYHSRLAARGDRVRIAMGDTALRDAAASAEKVQQRRLMWMRRFFEVHEMGAYHRSASPHGPLVLALMTQRWLDHLPEYRVAPTDQPPPDDLADAAWRPVRPIALVRGSPHPINADENVGFQADLPTEVRMLQDATNLYVAIRSFQWVAPDAA